ncbi:MAG: hypothetical protein QW751_02900 [Candidatus Aenigmatarchaeota archaeon]
MPETAIQPNPEKKKMKAETKAIIAFMIIGIVVGILSWLIGKFLPGNQGNFTALALAIFVLGIVPQLLKVPFGINEKFKWWLANGGWIYLFIWFIVWIIFYNIM